MSTDRMSDLERMFERAPLEAFVITEHLRFVLRPRGAVMERVLQQMFQGSLGTQRWEDVPLHVESKTGETDQ